MSFRLKTFIGIAFIEIVLLAIFTTSSLNFLIESNQRELDTRAVNTASLFAQLSKDALLATDLDSLETSLNELLDSPEIVFARIRDDSGVVVEGGDQAALKRDFSADSSFQEATDGILDIAHPIEESGYALGTIEMGFSVQRLQALVKEARQRFIFIAAIEVMLVALFSFVLGSYLTRHLKQLAQAAKRISEGEIGTQVEVSGKDELSQTAGAFNRMSSALHGSNRKMQAQINQGLSLARRAKESEIRLSTILNSMADAIITIDDKGIIESINHYGAKKFGYTEQELLGRNVTVLMADDVAKQHDRYIQRNLRSGTPFAVGKTRNLEAKHRDGSMFPMELTVSEMIVQDKHLFVGLVRDISEQRRLQLDQQRSDTIKAAIVDANLDGLITIDSKGLVMEFSSQASAMFGYTLEEAIGAEMAGLIVPHSLREGHRQGMKRYLETGEKRVSGQRIEITALRRSGEVFPVELTVTPIEVEDDTIFTAFVRDISSRKRSEQELNDARIAAEEASRAKSRFLAHMSHEIRSPLNAMMGSVELLVDSPLGREQKLYATTALTSGRALLGVVNDVLDFSRIETNQLKLEQREFSVRELIADVITLVDQRASEKNLDIGSYVDCDIPESILGDSVRVRQVLLNFADNAVKFTNHGGIALTAALTQSTDQDLEITFVVEDTGIGISADNFNRVFEEFARVDETEAALVDGTGLGLAISKQLVDLMGGRIKVESQPESGSRFEFVIPFRQPATSNKPLSPSLDANIILAGFATIASRPLEKQLKRFGCSTGCVEKVSDVDVTATKPGVSNWIIINESSDFSESRQQLDHLRGAGWHTALVSRLSSIAAKRTELKFDRIIARPLNSMVLMRILQQEESPAGALPEPQTMVQGNEPQVVNKVLLAEDSPANQLVAKAILVKSGFDVIVAENGIEAVQAFEDEKPDLILMDLRMPEMDGIEAVTQIRNRPQGGEVPIIGLSANIHQQDIDRCLAAGMNDFISKPFNPANLIDTIRSYLGVQK